MRELIAILRGVKTEEISPVAQALVEAGITRIEVPLNSPDPLETIERLGADFGDRIEFGAGTVLSVEDVKNVAATGANMIVSPNCNTDVIRATKTSKMLSFPGVMTPTECFAALGAGADGLKFFPAGLIGIEGLKAVRAVLPTTAKLYMVGGVDAAGFAAWIEAGATGFGIGSAIYKPGWNADQVGQKAAEIVAAYDAAHR